MLLDVLWINLCL